MTEKFSKKRWEELKQLVIQCVLSRFTTIEALQYIRQKLHVSISERYYYQIKTRIATDTNKQIAYFKVQRCIPIRILSTNIGDRIFAKENAGTV